MTIDTLQLGMKVGIGALGTEAGMDVHKDNLNVRRPGITGTLVGYPFGCADLRLVRHDSNSEEVGVYWIEELVNPEEIVPNVILCFGPALTVEDELRLMVAYQAESLTSRHREDIPVMVDYVTRCKGTVLVFPADRVDRTFLESLLHQVPPHVVVLTYHPRSGKFEKVGFELSVRPQSIR